MNPLRMYCFALGCLIVLFATAGIASAATPEEAARGLLQRILPDRVDEFVLQTIPEEDGQDVFELESVDGKIVVRGSDGVAIASGVNWYLKYYCQCHLSFNGDQLDLPETLPVVGEKVRQVSPFRYRYCFNFCAFSYTLAWWDWDQWERMIDWMALNGINMPLSVTGQEAIWQKVYRDLGLTDEQIDRFFVGPGFLPFGWMGCMDGWCGPVPQSWIDSHLVLQKKIVARQRALGMTPVLQGFTGHVPAALREKFPDARLQRLPSWCQFPGTHFVDPTDPLFERIGKAFIQEQTRQFGTDHLYASDTFIEMQPPSNDPEFLAAMGRAVHGAMTAGDPDAVWVMQGWIFSFKASFWQRPQREALLGSVPDERMIVLDLHCESTPMWSRTEAFHGKPWVWCIIHNFGGTVGLFGGLQQFSQDLAKALASPERGKLRGIGMIMEGFGYNPIVFDRIGDMAFRSKVPPLQPWVRDFANRRYGKRIPEARDAWQLLVETAYRLPGNPRSIVCRRPSLSLGHATPYDPIALYDAWEKLLACADRLEGVETYEFDTVHLTRQVLVELAATMYADIIRAYRAEDREALAKANARFLQLLDDLDRLLATRGDFLLGRWLADAKRW
ncbi:MAG: alpha-N-acetylglucosaminidase, partial [Planctomycetes bacterium]|nr:alpha-N-acetylglucosaminidase [Planctomycetota bacterium]